MNGGKTVLLPLPQTPKPERDSTKSFLDLRSVVVAFAALFATGLQEEGRRAWLSC